jgi:hypothetical protein
VIDPIGTVAAICVLAALASLGLAVVVALFPSLTTLEALAYGPVLGWVLGSILILGLAGPLGLLPAVLIVAAFSGIGAVVYWPRSTAPASGSATATGWPGRARDLARTQIGPWAGVVIGLFVVRMALLWTSALVLEPDGLWAGHIYIWGDWTVHLGDTTAFAYADNFPPVHPRLAGAPLAYHYLISLTAAGMVAVGMDPIAALPLQSFLLSLCLILGLFVFALRLSGDRAVAALALSLFMLGGSLGWLLLFDPSGGGPVRALIDNPWDPNAQQDANFWWFNPYFALVMSQRAALYGIPLVLLVLTVVHDATQRDDRAWRDFAAAGAIAGTLPLAHLGSFAALGLITPVLAVLTPRRGWLAFFAVWVAIGGAILLGVQGGEARSSSGLRWEPGWLSDEDPWPWFWLKNWGLFIPLGVLGLLTPRMMAWPARRLLLSMLPIFVVANLFILSVFRWDNSKVLLFAFLALAILSATALVALWRVQRDLISRALIVVAVAVMVASGVLTNVSQLRGLDRTLMERPVDLALADWVNRETPASAVFVVGFEHNDPVPTLTGRQIVAGYAPWLTSIGLDSSRQQADVRSIYRYDERAPGLLADYGVDYVVIGTWEVRELDADDAAFAQRYPLVFESSEYRVYRITDG